MDTSHLTRAYNHFKPSHLEDENPLEVLRRKEKGKEHIIEDSDTKKGTIKCMKEVN